MILAALDTPFVLPQTMAFAANQKDLEQLKQIAKQIEEKKDWAPLHALGLKNRKVVDQKLAATRFQVDSAWLMDLAEKAEKAAAELNVECDLKSQIKKFRQTPLISIAPSVFLEVSQFSQVFNFIDSLTGENKDELQFVAEVRLKGLIEALQKFDTTPDLEEEIRGPFEDEKGNLKIPARILEETSLSEDEMDDFILISRLRGQVQSYLLSDALVGSFVRSQGPGPFLPAPPSAKKWELRIAGIEVASFSVLEKEDIDSALAWVENEKPSHRWHEPFGLMEISDEDWNSLLSEGYWKDCKERFIKLLQQARSNNQAVLLFENDLGHPFWPGPYWPPRSRA